jgi:hypothetical protein
LSLKEEEGNSGLRLFILELTSVLYAFTVVAVRIEIADRWVA